MNWPALESDPEIFTSYFRSIGLSQNYEFAEVFTLEEEIPCEAVILAYNYTGENPPFEGEQIGSQYFIKQVNTLDNACGLIASIHAILNSNIEVAEGSILSELKEGVRDKSPEDAAAWLIHHEGLHNTHRQYAQEGQSNITDAPNYHFVAVMPGFVLYDGLKQSPIRLNCEGSLSLGFFRHVQHLLENNRISEDMNIMVLKSTN
ncbi:unnamed protein product [Blepharisma stoltei]|uniref:Ubiquitin carboxyl-terminal hydrolase n=1 Tax=Blepharisma stoltei TaxID=1481888 RepID=A0AAU9K8H5_9CILI|nr:unnamed protein product [Blepharisma stoltei]